MERQIAAVKPERSHFDVLFVGRSEAHVRVACLTLSGDIATVQPFMVTEIDAQPVRPTIGIGVHTWDAVTITPLH